MFDEEKGYGFIRPYDGSEDLFAHQTDIESGMICFRSFCNHVLL